MGTQEEAVKAALREVATTANEAAQKVLDAYRPMMRHLEERRREVDEACERYPWVRDAIDDAERFEAAANDVLRYAIPLARDPEYVVVRKDALDRLQAVVDEV